MSQENVEMVRREYVALAARDWVAIAETWHPDIELEALKADPEAGTYRGLDETTRYFDTWSEPYLEYRVEADEILDAGDRVVRWSESLPAACTAAIPIRGCSKWLYRLIRFKEGKIWRVKEYSTRAQALEAAGLSE
jgi:ketosteroid isomerase-like protein